jgi:hypothetical protein
MLGPSPSLLFNFHSTVKTQRLFAWCFSQLFCSGWLFTAEPRVDLKMIIPHLDVLIVDIKTLQDLLERGLVKSSHLVNLYLDQIQRHDDYLHGMLTMPSREALQKIATALDEERAAGKVRSKLHGIPVILKVKPSINTYKPLMI